MLPDRLKDYLQREHVTYRVIDHGTAYTAQRTAEVTHLDTHAFAKTVLVVLDGKLAMAVVPASHRLDLDLLKQAAHANDARLADESEFGSRFADCEVGAMPPFGNLYGLDVLVDKSLAEHEFIAFNAGSHSEVIRLAYPDFDRLARPGVVALVKHDEKTAAAPLQLPSDALAVFDVFTRGGQPACSAEDLRSLSGLTPRQVEAGVRQLERLDLLRVEFTTAEECGYELTPAGRRYLEARRQGEGARPRKP
jgi:Ala-tRNA(Pro) deacylase